MFWSTPHVCTYLVKVLIQELICDMIVFFTEVTISGGGGGVIFQKFW